MKVRGSMVKARRSICGDGQEVNQWLMSGGQSMMKVRRSVIEEGQEANQW